MCTFFYVFVGIHLNFDILYDWLNGYVNVILYIVGDSLDRTTKFADNVFIGDMNSFRSASAKMSR